MNIKSFFLSAFTMLLIPVTSIAVPTLDRKELEPKRGAELEKYRTDRRGESHENRSSNSSDQRLLQLERSLLDLEYRVKRLERDADDHRGGGITGYYCIAQCQGDSNTAKGGRGKSQSAAKQAAIDELGKRWRCHIGIEILECSEEYGQ